MEKKSTIGGQALIEGVMMRGVSSMAIAVRNQDDDILLQTYRLKKRNKIKRIPILRGIISFVSSLVVGIKALTLSSMMCGDEDEKISKTAMTFSILLAVIFAVSLFILLPTFFGDLFYKNVKQNTLIKNLASGCLRLCLFIAYLALVSLLKDIRRTFMYHGAEHKTINCYEKGMDLTVENVKKCSTRHNRCGTTFLFLVMLISILVSAFADYFLYLFFDIQDNLARNLVFFCFKLALLPIIAGISYEILFLLARASDKNILARIFRFPGLALQKLTTKEPDEDMIEVALISFKTVLEMDSNLSIKPHEYTQVPLSSTLTEVRGKLREIDVEEVEAEWLLCHILDCTRNQLLLKEYITLSEQKQLNQLLEERKENPLDYCLGESNFFGYKIKVDKRVLIPRPETEILAELAINAVNSMNKKEIRVLDLCTGSGCIALSISKQTNALVTASDISQDALDIAKQNLSATDVTLIASDLFCNLHGQKFDVIVSNPPYIAYKDIESLQREVKKEPLLALNGGEDGLSFYRRIESSFIDHLNEDGIMFLEMGINQSDQIKQIFSSYEVKIIKDLSGIDRFIEVRVK